MLLLSYRDSTCRILKLTKSSCLGIPMLLLRTSLRLRGLGVWLGYCEESWLFSWQLAKVLSTPLEVVILLDLYSCLFCARVLLIATGVLIFSSSYIRGEVFFSRFHLLVVRFVLSIILLIISPNLMRILLGWDGLGVTSYLLVMYYGRTKSANAALLTALSNRVGDVCIVVAIAWVSLKGSWQPLFRLSPLSWWAMGAVALGAFTKRAQIPFSAWLPAAIAAPTPVSALVHSSTLVTAGVYLLFRFHALLEAGQTLSFLLAFGVLTMTMAGLAAINEIDIKKVVALSTLSQLGLMVSTLGLGLSKMAFFHLLSHAYFKAILFMAVGNIIHCRNAFQDIREVGNLAEAMPLRIRLFNLANLRLCGFPFLVGFYSKDLILEEVLMGLGSTGLLFLFFFATLLTAAYSTRLALLAALRLPPFSSLRWASDNDWAAGGGGLVLVLLAIAGGPALRSLLLPYPSVCFLPLLLKLLTLWVVITGVGVGAASRKPATRFCLWGLATIWFLPLISRRKLSVWALQASFSLRALDLMWLEWTSAHYLARTSQRWLLLDASRTSHSLLTLLLVAGIWGVLFSLLYLYTLSAPQVLKIQNFTCLTPVHNKARRGRRPLTINKTPHLKRTTCPSLLLLSECSPLVRRGYLLRTYTNIIQIAPTSSPLQRASSPNASP